MKITIACASITVGDKTRTLTKSMAKQLPLICGTLADSILHNTLFPCKRLCKVTGKALGVSSIPWFILVNHMTRGYVWLEYCRHEAQIQSVPQVLL